MGEHMVRLEEFESPAFVVGRHRSIQLSYGRIMCVVQASRVERETYRLKADCSTIELYLQEK